MSKYIPFFIASMTMVCCTMCAQSDQNNNNQSSQNDSNQSDDVVWIGPGLYFGLWFATEAEFIGWRRNHLHYHYHYHYDHDHDRDHDRDHGDRRDQSRAAPAGGHKTNVHQHYHREGGGRRGGGHRGGGRR